MKKTLVEARNLFKSFKVAGRELKAVHDFSLSIAKGEIVGLVGESGCGKSTVGKSILRLEEPTSGTIQFDGIVLKDLSRQEMKRMRRRMQMIFQDPFASLNPRMNVQDILGEPLDIHRLMQGSASSCAKKRRQDRIEELLDLVGLNHHHMKRLPHQFSGGQRQRIGIARALAVEPEFLVCDEPISGLDVSIQAQVINLLKKLKEQMNLTYLFISHDLAMIRYLCDTVAVMYLGHLVELAASADLYRNPLHPYTQALLSAILIPDPDIERKRKRIVLKGELPNPLNPPSGCPFRTRCPYAQEICRLSKPPLREVAENRQVACHFVNP